jgi:hypothetical protein
LIARVCRFQRKQLIFELLEHFVRRLIIEVDFCRIVGEQINGLEFGVVPQQFPSVSCFRPIPTQYLIKSEDFCRHRGHLAPDCSESVVGV